MEKNIHFFYEGQSVTPIMQKFDDLKCAIARYNRVTAQSEKPKIAFAYGIITFIYDAIDALECYQADLDKCECRDALALAFMELADKGFWLKDDRLRHEMHAFADKPLDSYGVTLGLNGVVYQDTLHIYRVIEEGIERMVALLKQVEATLKAAPPVLYQNFYRNLRAQYCEEQAVKDFGDWLMHSGKISLCKLKSFRAQAIADYVNSGILRCALEPSEEEKSQVDVEEIKSQLPSSYPYEEWFDNCYAVFCRTVSWEGHILVPDYSCAGLFIFQNWDKLTEKDIQAIFHLDKMLELIHEKMLQLNDDIVPELPDVLVAPEAMVRAVEQTMTQGYWWANTSWAIVYRVYQMKGYKGSISQFEREIKTWPWKKELVFPCTYDGIQKPLSSGKLTRTIDKWEEDGASKQMINLGEALLNYLK